MLLHQKKNHYLRIGLAITAVITAMALVGCFWTPYAPTAMSGSEKFAAPSLRHLFGTDNFGRDIFSRVMVGARTTFFISACTVTIGAVVGTLVGALTGYFGGLVDELLMPGQRRCHRLSQHPAGAGVHLPAGLRHLQRHSGAGHRLHPQLRPCHTGGVQPGAGR